MALAPTSNQEFIDNTLFETQCCIGNITEQVANQEYIGINCKDLKDDLLILYAIQLALLKYDPTILDEDSCLTSDEVNIMINKAKTICKNCCIELVDI